PLIQDVNQEYKRFFIRHKVYPNVIEEQKELTVETDEKWLFFIISQLVHNAVKYSAGSAETFNIRLAQTNGQARLEIQDFGIGIPKEDLKRIFDAFYTGENGRKYRESTGVGLFLVSEITQHLGHSLTVDSVVGEGTVFKVKFK